MLGWGHFMAHQYNKAKYNTYSRRQKNKEIRSIARYYHRIEQRTVRTKLPLRGYIRHARNTFESIARE